MEGWSCLDQLAKRKKLITQWILEAGEIIRNSHGDSIQVEQKSNRNDLVTELDKQTEKTIISHIQQHFPGERIFAEESDNKAVQDLSGIVWIIDPIDGTLNFVKQKDHYAIMIAVYEDGIGQLGYIYDVEKDELYSATKGEGASCNGRPLAILPDTSLKDGLVAISSCFFTRTNESVRKICLMSNGVRMIGSAGIESIYVSTGKVVAYIAASLAPWDMAAAKVIGAELGLVYSNHQGKEIDLLKKSPVIFATPRAHQKIVEMLTNSEVE